MRRIGLAVSGGADSTALLLLMSELQTQLGFSAFVLHVDHGIRPDSAEDAAFVRSLSEDAGLPFHETRANVVRRPRESLEMAARRVRLDFFAKMTRELRLDAIATGHHADDVAETFILRLARGSGPEGLAGLKQISHVNEITFIRPFLNVRHSDIVAFLERRGVKWREDSTNADTSIPRNNVRHVVIPWLCEHLDRRIVEHLCKSAAILRGDLSLPPATTSGADAGAQTGTPTEERPRFRLEIAPAEGYEKAGCAIGELPATCFMSRKALAGRSLEVRTWRPGDRIAPTGMGGKSRKLQDVFVTAKTPPAVRATLPTLVDAVSGETLWVPGYRVAESVAVESQTAPSWRMTLQKEEE